MIFVTKSSLPPLEEYNKYLKKIWLTSWLTNNGQFVQRLQKRLRDYLHVEFLSLVTNGTLALQIPFKALNLTGEVITTPFTFAATTNVIFWEGAVPVFADIDSDTFNINPDDVEKKITEKTSAILAVHVYGNPCDVERLEKIGKKYNIKIIYDAAHAFGVEYKGEPLLKYGDISTLSFHATKVFHTIEGGAIITKDQKIFSKIELLKDFGILTEESVILPGINAKMNEFQAAMGLCNLKTVDKEIARREKIYKRYLKGLSHISSLKFQKLIASRYNYSYMPICFPNKRIRDSVFQLLLGHNIKTRKYFYPLTVEADFVKRKTIKKIRGDDLKIAYNSSNRILCLPIYSELPIHDVDRIVDLIKKIVSL